MKKLDHWLLHPFLFGVYSVVALLSANIRQSAPLFALRSLLFALMLTILTLLFSRLIMGDWRKAALVTTLAVLIFFNYGRLFDAIRDIYLFGVRLARHRLLIGLFTAILVGFGWLTYKKLNVPAWTRLFNLIGIIAVLMAVFQIAWYEIKLSYDYSHQPTSQVSLSDLGISVAPGKTPPDIYYIVLDTYTRADAMQVNFKFDNSPFVDALTQKGFYVASCSRSNYATSYQSFTSFLNFNYLPTLNPEFVYPTGKDEDLFPYLQDNQAMQVLRDLGYKTIGFETGFAPTEFKLASYYFLPQPDALGSLAFGGLNPFEVIVTQNSLGIILYDYSVTHPDLRVFTNSAYTIFRNRMVYAMDKLPTLISMPGPKFIFLHMLAPHNPFAFTANGDQIVRRFPFALNGDQEVQYIQDYAAGYTAEVTYLNTRFLEIISQIQQNSSVPPIIILQGDHGIPRLSDWHMPILNAYFLPGGGEKSLYPTISPVNTFRVIFDSYFGAHLGLLPDKVCDAKNNDPFNCTVTPDPNPQCQILP